ncbi:beta-phosphoglucomutase [Buttiauxella sp. JUb87]|uniref:beta-phosphoglucomutase n=1 Tax=unclassified Buttiauxella TaxID=2634062 RepID=UPI001061FB0A|nr:MULTISPECIES: beta-phosphoglucomutase [unclassified Buttiauxella]TDN54396.1 beta-phosphoglucomutase [Buttiauxella sp. JUb87]
MKPEAVIFDLDGVVTDTAHLHFLAWRQVAGEIGIEIDERINEQLKGISRMDSLARILRSGGAEQRFDSQAKIKLAERKNTLYVASLQHLDPAAILPGIAALLEELHHQHIRVGLASVSLNAPRILQALRLKGQFDFCADASQIEHSKPDPEIFLAACAGLGVEPARCIGIEDAQAGIEAINASGMLSVGVGSGLEHADLLLPTTAELNWPLLQTFWLTKHSAHAV